MTANPMRGEVALGDHKLVVTFNSLCALEAEMGREASTIFTMMQSGVGFGLSELRTAVRVFLDTPMNDEQVGELIASLGVTAIGSGKKKEEYQLFASAQLMKAIDAFFAPPKKETDARPLKAA